MPRKRIRGLNCAVASVLMATSGLWGGLCPPASAAPLKGASGCDPTALQADPGVQWKAEQTVRAGRVKLIDADFTRDDPAPKMSVYAVDRSFNVLHAAEVASDGRFELPPDYVSQAHLVLVGPQTDDFSQLDRTTLVQYRPAQFRQLLATRGSIEISKVKWSSWKFVIRCMHGSVRHCYPYPWIIDELIWRAAAPQFPQAKQHSGEATPSSGDYLALRREARLSDALLAVPFPRPVFPFGCEPICDGVVEVYRRTCCCPPFIIDDLRIPEIIFELEEILPEPPIPWPPGPRPDPPPFEDVPFLLDGALSEKMLNARRDLHALQTLPRSDLVTYIQARPYLFCTRGPAVKVATGFIQPDGEFTICWVEPTTLLLFNCHREYSFVVSQVINGSSVTIYDGLSAQKWFRYGHDADLVSYHPDAIGCQGDDVPPGTGAFALLQDIGDTGSFDLKTPDATGWDRVASPDYNDGLALPAASPAAAEGVLKNCNWGGTLKLRFHFSEPMRSSGVGAKYYRVSIRRSDGFGNPIGPRTYLSDNVTWRRYEVVGMDIFVKTTALGPTTVAGGASNLFMIPYRADDEWQSGQYHAELNTTRFSHGRHLLTLEVFDDAGKQLKPNSAPASDPGKAAAFTFRRWFQETGPTAEVPFGALTHMLWWDNRSAQAELVDLRKNGVPNTAQCQFLTGAGSSTFSAGYRAYHPVEMFQFYHTMWWRRGLGGPWGSLISKEFDNVGQPPAVPGESGAATFEHMLTKPPGSHTRCTFALNLRVYVKTFDGQDRLWHLDASDQAAFALERTDP